MGTLIVRHGRAPDDLRVDRNSSEPRTRPQCPPRPRPTLCPPPPPWKASHPGLNLIKYKISIYCRNMEILWISFSLLNRYILAQNYCTVCFNRLIVYSILIEFWGFSFRVTHKEWDYDDLKLFKIWMNTIVWWLIQWLGNKVYHRIWSLILYG